MVVSSPPRKPKQSGAHFSSPRGNVTAKRSIHAGFKVRKALLVAAAAAISCSIGLSVIYFVTIIRHDDLAVPDDASVAFHSIQLRKTTAISSSPHRNWTFSGPVTATEALQMPPLNYRIIRLADTLITSPSTVVAGYFLTDSKFSSETYLKWMSNMLSTQDALVVFTEAALVSTIRQYRQHALNATVIVEMTLHDLPISQLHDDDKYPTPERFWQHQLDVDPERRLHKSYKLFWIWLSKSWWVTRAIDFDFFQSHFYMYSDIGCYRHTRYNDKTIIQHMELVPDGTILWMAHHDINPPPTVLWNRKLDPLQKQHFYHSGSQGAGTAQAWRDYHTVVSETLDAFVQRDMFIGEDQCVLQSACLMAPRRCAYAPRKQVRDNSYFGMRFILHYGGDYEFWRPPMQTVGGA